MTRATTRWRTLALALAGVVTLLPGAGPIDASAPVEPTDGALTIVRTDVSAHPVVALELAVPATLTGGPVSADQVVLLEAGRPLAFDLTAVPTELLEVVLLIDTSGSMNDGDAIGAARVAAAGFLDELPAEVPVGIVGFDDSPSLVSPLTADRDQLRAALAGLTASGETALYDAVVFGASLFSGGTADRQVVLLSDGGDTVSASTLDDAVAAAGGIRTSAIELVTFESNRAALETLTAGEGRLISVDDPAALADLYREVATSLVNRYRLTFTTERSGPTPYTVDLTTPAGLVTASTSVTLPEPPTDVETPTGTLTGTPTETSTPDTGAATSAPGTDEPPAPPAIPPPSSGAGGSSNSDALLIGGAVAVFASLTLLLLSVWPEDVRRGAGRRNLGVEHARATRGGNDGTGMAERLSAMTDQALERGGRRRGLAEALDVAALALRPGEFVVIVVATAVTAALVLGVLFGPFGVLVAAVAVPLGARALLRIRGDRRRRAFAEQLPDVLQLLTSGLRAGYALPQAIDAVASQAAEPARSEFQRVMFEARVGRDLSESLRSAADRMHSTDFEWVVSAFEINREVGGELAQILENVAATIRERQELARQVRTLTAEGRISAYVLTGLPIVMILAMLLVNPSYLEPLTEAPGPALLAGCGALLLAGWLWMRRLIKAQL